jgi:hypothetical protein
MEDTDHTEKLNRQERQGRGEKTNFQGGFSGLAVLWGTSGSHSHSIMAP